jgi:non-ribosomal peptide synthetase component F
VERAGAGESRYAQQFAHLAEDETTELREFARRHQLTLNTLMLGAWALLLGRHAGQEDVVFGTVVAGRPAELEGSDSMVGVFINTLPMRARVDGAARLLEWLKGLQAQHAELRQFEYTPLVEVQNWSEAARGRPLFETLLNFTNYPLDQSLSAWDGPVRIRDLRMFEKASFALALVADARRRLDLEFKYDAERFEEGAVAALLAEVTELLREFVRRPESTLKDFDEVLEEAGRRRQLLKQEEFKEARRKMLESRKARGGAKGRTR